MKEHTLTIRNVTHRKAQTIVAPQKAKLVRPGRRAPRRDSFRTYWREPHSRYPVEGPRRARRAVALQLWRRTKGLA